MREAFVSRLVPRDRAVLVALGLLSHRGLVHSHARQVFEAVLRSPILDDDLRRDLCRRILFPAARDPDEGLRPKMTVLRGEPSEDMAVVEIAGVGRLAMSRRDMLLCRRPVIVDAVRRYAAKGLARLEHDPSELVKRALGQKLSVAEECGRVMGALDLIAELHGAMDGQFVRQALDTWMRAPVGAVKLRAYEVSVQLNGPWAARPALRDGGRKVREWAAAVLGGAGRG